MIFKPPQITERIPDVTNLGSPMPQKSNVLKLGKSNATKK